MIEVSQLTKIYGKEPNSFAALSDVSFTIKEGAKVAITGKSGSGKSTLMHVMSGLDRPTSGSVVMNGEAINAMKQKTVDQFRATKMSFIFQAFFVEANQTSYQNVVLPLEIAKVPRNKREKLVKDALKAVELESKVNALAGNLSGGQKQRLAIARAIVHKPKLIFADEPTGNLDSITGDKIIKLLFNINKKLGSTLVIVTHDQDLAAKCDEQIQLKDGKVINVSNRKNTKRKRT